MPSRRYVLKTVALVSASQAVHSQEARVSPSEARSSRGFMIPPTKSRRGVPLLLRGKDPTTVKVSGSDTNGQMVVFETTSSPGEGPRLHRHLEQDEWWYVLEGEFVFQVGEEKFRVPTGGSVFGPRRVPHSFISVGNVPGRMIISFQPAGQMEEFFVEYAKVSAARAAGQQPARFDDARYGLETVGPRVSPDDVK